MQAVFHSIYFEFLTYWTLNGPFICNQSLPFFTSFEQKVVALCMQFVFFCIFSLNCTRFVHSKATNSAQIYKSKNTVSKFSSRATYFNFKRLKKPIWDQVVVCWKKISKNATARSNIRIFETFLEHECKQCSTVYILNF